MTVTMTIEEYDELRESKNKLDDICDFIYRNLYYEDGAENCEASESWKYVKGFDKYVVQNLAKTADIFPNRKHMVYGK